MKQAINKIIVFKNSKIRRTWYKNEWYYSIVDIIKVLVESPNYRQYWGKLKQREFTDLQLYPIWVQLKLESLDKKKHLTDCVNTKNAFRVNLIGLFWFKIYNHLKYSNDIYVFASRYNN